MNTVWRSRPGSNRISHPIRASLPGTVASATASLAEHLGVNARAAGPLEGAACASPGLDRNAMFPDKSDRRGADFARRVCASCPVSKDECLVRFGMLSHGVVAGMTVNERRALRVAGGR